MRVRTTSLEGSSPPRRRWWCCLAIIFAGAPALGGQDSVLIPREQNAWDGALRRGVQRIRGGDLRGGIRILQSIAEDAASGRALKAVADDFGPASLLGGEPIDAPKGEGDPSPEETDRHSGLAI